MWADLSNLTKASQFNLRAALIYSHMILKYELGRHIGDFVYMLEFLLIHERRQIVQIEMC